MTDPTSFHPGLTTDRLRTLASVLVRVRREALDLHDTDAGEGNLSLGTRTFERACEGYRRLSAEVDWLKTFEQGYYFLLRVDDVPIKFHRTDPDDPAPRTTRELQPETSFKQEAFAFMATGNPTSSIDSLGYNWRLFFQDDLETRQVLRVALVRVDVDGKTEQSWDIDLTDTVVPVVGLGGYLPEAPELEQPEVGPISTPVRKTDDVG